MIDQLVENTIIDISKGVKNHLAINNQPPILVQQIHFCHGNRQEIRTGKGVHICSRIYKLTDNQKTRKFKPKFKK